MSDIILESEQLRNAASTLSNAVQSIPTVAPLAMNSVSASDVTASASDFNLWVTYTALITRAKLTSIAESTSAGALAMEQYEAQLAASAVAQ